MSLDLRSVRNNLWLYLHDWHDLPNGYDWNTQYVKPHLAYAITYSTKSFQLLESPYPTNCIHYPEKTRYYSRKDCIRKCRIKESLSKCGVIADETNVFKWEAGRFANTTEEKDCLKIMDLDKFCANFCPNMDCVKNFYTPKEMYSLTLNQSQAKVGFKTPLEPKTIYWHKPKIETIEFLCYGASILSLWFGVSISTVYFWFDKLIVWVRGRLYDRKLSKFLKSSGNKTLMFEKKKISFI